MRRPEPIRISCDDCPGGSDCDECLVGFVLGMAEERAKVRDLAGPVADPAGAARRPAGEGPAQIREAGLPGDLGRALDTLRAAGLRPVVRCLDPKVRRAS